jgi:hypothetical protein
MRCFMLRDGHVVMAAVLPENIADDEEAIAAGRAAYAAAATAIDRLEGFEIWDLERKVYEGAPAPPTART